MPILFSCGTSFRLAGREHYVDNSAANRLHPATSWNSASEGDRNFHDYCVEAIPIANAPTRVDCLVPPRVRIRDDDALRPSSLHASR